MDGLLCSYDPLPSRFGRRQTAWNRPSSGFCDWTGASSVDRQVGVQSTDIVNFVLLSFESLERHGGFYTVIISKKSVLTSRSFGS